ncbi:MAG: PEP-CTERM sorting domain-containing protein [Syntrophorhabdus sp.]
MKNLVLVFCVVMAIAIGSQASATSILSFEPFVSSINSGDSVDVNVVISGLRANDAVGGFDFNVVFDDSVLAFDSYSLTDNLGSIPAYDADDWSLGDLGGGTVNIAELSWLSDLSFQDDSFVLATLSFTGIGVGTSSLLFDNIIISDAQGSDICTVPSFGIVKVNPVDPVPEPATMVLLGAGIVGLVGSRIRRKKK